MEEIDNILDATSFESASIDYSIEFRNLLEKIYGCYSKLILEHCLLSNHENHMRDLLLVEYLQNQNIRNNICNIFGFRFDKEVDVKDGRVDIKIISLNDFERDEAFYVIECKRLDGYSTLNKSYVEHGIKRFTTSYKSKKEKYYYPTHYGINAMIGFIIKDINIDSNIKKIGESFICIEKNKFYKSEHEKIDLYHLMMDFSKIIKTKNRIPK